MNDFVIFLVSGGASSIVALPDGISLKNKKIVTNLLLKSGANIKEINCIRKHLSKIKGGRLIQNLSCDGISLVMSDVVYDDLSSIASGTTYYDNTTFSEAFKILKKYNLIRFTPKAVLHRLKLGMSGKIHETPKHSMIQNQIISSNKDCLFAMSSKSKKLRISTKIIHPVMADVKYVAKKLVNSIPKKLKSSIIFGGEPTVNVKGKGKGGRNQELVLHILKNLPKTQSFTVASLGTDGIDGNTKYAGAISTNNSISKKTIDRYLKFNNSNAYFKKYGGLILTGPTHTNLMDIGIILRL